MQNIVIDIMNQFGYLGIGLLIVVETVFPPIPSELILTFGGFLTTCTEMTVIGVILVSTAASVAGAFLLYGLGALLSPQRFENYWTAGCAEGWDLKRMKSPIRFNGLTDREGRRYFSEDAFLLYEALFPFPRVWPG